MTAQHHTLVAGWFSCVCMDAYLCCIIESRKCWDMLHTNDYMAKVVHSVSHVYADIPVLKNAKLGKLTVP